MSDSRFGGFVYFLELNLFAVGFGLGRSRVQVIFVGFCWSSLVGLFVSAVAWFVSR